jgi:hypothetical protein
MQSVMETGLDILARMILLVAIVPSASMAFRFFHSCFENLKLATERKETSLSPISNAVMWAQILVGMCFSLSRIVVLDERYASIIVLTILVLVLLLLFVYFVALGSVKVFLMFAKCMSRR